MFPLLPFVAGMAAGAVVVKLLRSDSARAGLDKAQDKIRQATVSSLAAIENSSAAMRERLSPSVTGLSGASPSTTVAADSPPPQQTDKETT